MLSDFLLFIPAFLWGTTDPLLRKLSKGIEKVEGKTFIEKTYFEFKFIFTNLKYLIVFLLNQFGSFAFYIALAYSELSLVVPITNALTLVFTTITGYFLGEKINTITLFGLLFVIIGVGICVS